jgi:hypothetical protein
MTVGSFIAGFFRALGSLAPPPKPPAWSAACAYCGRSLRLTAPPDAATNYFCSNDCQNGWATRARHCVVCGSPAVDGELCMMCSAVWNDE